MKKILSLTAVTIIIDRIIKVLVVKNLKLNVKNKIINNFFYLTYCKNEGAAFSIFSGRNFFLIILTFIFLYLIFIFLKKQKKFNKFDIINYSLLIGGIIGNLIDRVLYSYVIDYLDFKILGYNFAIFNFADICIVISVFLLFFTKGSEEKDAKNNS